MLESALPEPIGAQPRLETLTTNEKARTWLDANCAGCHRPGGPTPAAMDLRATAPFTAMGICDALPGLGDLGIGGARLLLPGDPGRSILSVRAHLVGPGQMPPLARSLVDATGVAALDAWIGTIIACSSGPDSDQDGRADGADNCPLHPNASQADADGDGDGTVDWDGPGASHPDPQCHGLPTGTERLSCGLGVELPPLLAALAALRRRRR